MRRSFARCSLLDVAEQWDRMAENAERRAEVTGPAREAAAEIEDRA